MHNTCGNGAFVMMLKGKRIYLRYPRRRDAKILASALCCDEIYATTYGIPRQYTVEYAKWWIEFTKSSARNNTGYEMLIFTNEDEFVGCCAVNNINKDCRRGNLTYLIKPSLWGRGFATEAANLIIDFAFSQLGLERISGICMAHNIASEKVMLKLGFQYEGLARHEIKKDDEFIDVKHFGLLREDRQQTGEST